MNTKNNATDLSAEEWDQIDIGDQVKHAKWGVGTVLYRSGSGENAKAIVVFPEEGQKKLMLKFAKLIKVGSTSLKSVEKLKAETKPPKAASRPVFEEELPEEEALALGPVGDDEGLLIADENEVVGFDDDDEDFADRDSDEEEI